jgi:hypothetical protein
MELVRTRFHGSMIFHKKCVFQNSVCHTIYRLDTPEKQFGNNVIHTKYGNSVATPKLSISVGMSDSVGSKIV